MSDHPVVLLRALVTEEFTDDLPAGVHPIRQWCADPQFFPGATGLLSDASWNDVAPGSEGVLMRPPPAPQRGAIVLGNYQATLDSYQRILDGSIGGFPTTWRSLRRLMASLPPAEVFLTNAFIGLPDKRNDTAPFPTTPSFTRRCEGLLAREIELFRPRVVVCLGVAAAKMLAAITPALGLWRPWPGYRELHRHATSSVGGCSVASVDFVAVAVSHPSAVVSSDERQRDAQLIADASFMVWSR